MSIRILIGGWMAAAMVGATTAFVLAGHLAPLLPPPLRGYVLQASSAGFIAGGLALGSVVRGRWFVPWSFAAAAAVPGFAIPLLLVATQGIHRPIDLMAAQFVLPALAYTAMGAVDGLAVGLGVRRSLLAAAAFAAGVVLSPLILWALPWQLPPLWSIAMSLGVPWITGSMALAWLDRRAEHRAVNPA